MDTGIDSLKTTSKKVVHEAGEFLGNKISDAVTPSTDDKIVKQEPVEKIIIPPEKKRWNIKQIKKGVIKMEHYKISKLLNDLTVSKFVTKKWIEVNELSSGQYSVNKLLQNFNILFKTSMLRSDLCDYSDPYIVVKGAIDLLANNTNEIDKAEKDVTFKKNAPFRSCISKFNNTLMENAECLDIVMLMYNLLEYSHNYSMTSGSLWNYYRDKIDDVDDNAWDGKSFIYKTRIGNTLEGPGNEGDANRPPAPTLIVKVTIPVNYLSNFCWSFNLPLINCEIELDLSLAKDCVLIEQSNNITGVNFVITSTKLYIPVVTFSINYNMNFLARRRIYEVRI